LQGGFGPSCNLGRFSRILFSLGCRLFRTGFWGPVFSSAVETGFRDDFRTVVVSLFLDVAAIFPESASLETFLAVTVADLAFFPEEEVVFPDPEAVNRERGDFLTAALCSVLAFFFARFREEPDPPPGAKVILPDLPGLESSTNITWEEPDRYCQIPPRSV